ncbi:MAG: efflux RND transporter periplasmic adaptor subunit [Chromatiaceae bacterium]|nr:efflux RND transporter periplasmic adaptor subunit [Chromatiaceae bacterium]
MALIWGVAPSEVRAEGEIGAVCHLEPSSGILDLIGTPGARVNEILVKEGQKVEKDDILLKFDNYDLLKAQRELASLELGELEKTRDSKLALQKHAVKSAELAHERAEKKLSDQKQLGAVATSKRELTDLEDLALDARRLVEKEEMLYRQLEITLEAETLQARARLDLAEAQFKDAFLRAPISGTVLAVLKQVGESIGVGDPSDTGYVKAEATLRVAALDRMYAVCEVYEGDILNIREGLKADVASNALPNKITGKVERLSREVDTSSRLANAWVLLDEADLASQFIGMEVQVTIYPQ